MFKLDLKGERGETLSLLYDPHASSLTYEDGRPVDLSDVPDDLRGQSYRPFEHRVSKDNPGRKSRRPTRLKISFGLACNYACSYCSQRFVPRDDYSSKGVVEDFLAKLPSWLDMTGREDGKGLRFEFWGGEPLVYWRRLKPLAEALRERYPAAAFTIITNGSLLDAEKNEWLDRLGFKVGLSHDGPGQAQRGPDPLDDPERRAAILDLYRRLRPEWRMSFNAVLTAQHHDMEAIQRFFVDVTGDPFVPIGEGDLVTPYDPGGLAASPMSEEDYWAVTWDIYEAVTQRKAQNFTNIRQKLDDFFAGLINRRPIDALNQKCGMDRPDMLAVDLTGNVLTCQNVSAAATAQNGASHRIGHVGDFESIRLDTATHFAHRPNCMKCPVVQFCRGSCMFLEGRLFEVACKNSFHENVAYLAAAMYFLTGGMRLVDVVPVSMAPRHAGGEQAQLDATMQKGSRP